MVVKGRKSVEGGDEAIGHACPIIKKDGLILKASEGQTAKVVSRTTSHKQLLTSRGQGTVVVRLVQSCQLAVEVVRRVPARSSPPHSRRRSPSPRRDGSPTGTDRSLNLNGVAHPFTIFDPLTTDPPPNSLGCPPLLVAGRTHRCCRGPSLVRHAFATVVEIHQLNNTRDGVRLTFVRTFRHRRFVKPLLPRGDCGFVPSKKT